MLPIQLIFGIGEKAQKAEEKVGFFGKLLKFGKVALIILLLAIIAFIVIKVVFFFKKAKGLKNLTNVAGAVNKIASNVNRMSGSGAPSKGHSTGIRGFNDDDD